MHEMRNNLQGVSVNLEVDRSASEGDVGGKSVADLSQFARNASGQFEELTERIDALTGLLVEPHGLAELDRLLHAIARVLRSRDSNPMRYISGELPVQRSGVSNVVARLLVTHIVLAALQSGAVVNGTLSGAPMLVLHLTAESGVIPPMSYDVLRITTAAHIRVEKSQGGYVLTFPTRAGSDTVLV
jgi:hypothetical protein